MTSSLTTYGVVTHHGIQDSLPPLLNSFSLFLIPTSVTSYDVTINNYIFNVTCVSSYLFYGPCGLWQLTKTGIRNTFASRGPGACGVVAIMVAFVITLPNSSPPRYGAYPPGDLVTCPVTTAFATTSLVITTLGTPSASIMVTFKLDTYGFLSLSPQDDILKYHDFGILFNEVMFDDVMDQLVSLSSSRYPSDPYPLKWSRLVKEKRAYGDIVIRMSDPLSERVTRTPPWTNRQKQAYKERQLTLPIPPRRTPLPIPPWRALSGDPWTVPRGGRPRWSIYHPSITLSGNWEDAELDL